MSTLLRAPLLVTSSMMPGLAKLLGMEMLFGAGPLLLMLYLASLPPGAESTGSGVLAVRRLLLLFALYALGLGALRWYADEAIGRSMLIGLISFIVPLVSVAAAGARRSSQLLEDLPFAAAVHGVLALAIFPPLRPDIGWLGSSADALLEGAMFFRLSSVSGSLALSSIMAVAFAVALCKHLWGPERGRAWAWACAVLFLLCAFLTLQRGAWVAVCIVLAVATIEASWRRRMSLLALLAAVAAPIAAGAMLLDLPEGTYEVLTERLDTLAGQAETGVIAERSDQWIWVAQNFQRRPLGFGPGQLGQAARDITPPSGGREIYDGDYFRIASEYGVVGVALLLLLGASGLRAVRNMFGRRTLGSTPSYRVLAAASVGLMIQSVGTNVTELYLANALFWSLLLLQWREPRAAIDCDEVG